MMNRTLRIVDLVFTIVLFMYLSLVAYVGFENAQWKARCRDAGGVPASNMVCVNPGSVIEVN